MTGHDDLVAAADFCAEVGMCVLEDVFAELLVGDAGRQRGTRCQLIERNVSPVTSHIPQWTDSQHRCR